MGKPSVENPLTEGKAQLQGHRPDCHRVQLIRYARAAGYEVKAAYLATEDPALNLGRILIRVNNGGSFAPISRIPDDFSKGLKQLPNVRKLPDDLMLFDNTVHAHGVRLVAYFHEGRSGEAASHCTEVGTKSVPGRVRKGLRQG